MSEQDDQDPAAPDRKRRRSGHFDPNEEVPFTDAASEPVDFGPEEDPADRWDADDPRRQNDQMAPPAEPCECYCLHCGRTFMSDGIWFQRVINAKDGFPGFWMCPTPNCSGAGFGFDIFPTDPDHSANEGWSDDDGDDEFDDDVEFDEAG